MGNQKINTNWQQYIDEKPDDLNIETLDASESPGSCKPVTIDIIFTPGFDLEAGEHDIDIAVDQFEQTENPNQ